MKIVTASFFTLLVGLTAASDIKENDNNMDQINFSEIKPIGMNEKFKLKMDCKRFLELDPDVIAPAFKLVSMTNEENWEELVTNGICRQLFVEKSSIVGEENMRGILNHAETAKERLSVLKKIGSLQKIRGWGAIKENDLPYFQGLELNPAEIDAWHRFDPSILKSLITEEHLAEGLPLPIDKVFLDFSKILTSEFFNNPKLYPYWTIIDEKILILLSESGEGLYTPIFDWLANLILNVNEDWQRVIILGHTETLAKHYSKVFSNNPIKTKQMWETLIKIRTSLYENGGELIKNFAKIVPSEAKYVEKNYYDKFYFTSEIPNHQGHTNQYEDLKGIFDKKNLEAKFVNRTIGSIYFKYLYNPETKIPSEMLECVKKQGMDELRRFISSSNEGNINSRHIPLLPLSTLSKIINEEKRESETIMELRQMFEGKDKLRYAFLKHQIFKEKGEELTPLIFSLIKTVDELRIFKTLGYKLGNQAEPKPWILPFDENGADYGNFIKYGALLEYFSDDEVKVKYCGYGVDRQVVDNGGPMRSALQESMKYLYLKSGLMTSTIPGQDLETSTKFKFTIQNSAENGLFFGQLWRKGLFFESLFLPLSGKIYEILTAPLGKELTDRPNRRTIFEELYKPELEIILKTLKPFIGSNCEGLPYLQVLKDQFHSINSSEAFPGILKPNEQDMEKLKKFYFTPEELAERLEIPKDIFCGSKVSGEEEDDDFDMEKFQKYLNDIVEVKVENEKKIEVTQRTLLTRRVQKFAEELESKLYKNFNEFWDNFLTGFGYNFDTKGLQWLNPNILKEALTMPTTSDFKTIFKGNRSIGFMNGAGSVPSLSLQDQQLQPKLVPLKGVVLAFLGALDGRQFNNFIENWAGSPYNYNGLVFSFEKNGPFSTTGFFESLQSHTSNQIIATKKEEEKDELGFDHGFIQILTLNDFNNDIPISKSNDGKLTASSSNVIIEEKGNEELIIEERGDKKPSSEEINVDGNIIIDSNFIKVKSEGKHKHVIFDNVEAIDELCNKFKSDSNTFKFLRIAKRFVENLIRAGYQNKEDKIELSDGPFNFPTAATCSTIMKANFESSMEALRTLFIFTELVDEKIGDYDHKEEENQHLLNEFYSKVKKEQPTEQVNHKEKEDN